VTVRSAIRVRTADSHGTVVGDNDSSMYVLALEMQIRIVNARSLKDKRQIVKSVLEGARRRFAVSAAEVGQQEARQRGVLGFAVVAPSASHAEEVIDAVDRYVWSRLDLEIVSAERIWME
jgi:uncharacterized protein YlxP (DUF503 family)